MKKLITLSGAVLTLALTGCASSDDMEDVGPTVNDKLDSLMAQVDSLSAEHASLRADQAKTMAVAEDAKDMAEVAAEEAAKANDRIDNVVSSYKK
ncbi:Lpp/OprI family alanine-zipper lipoprotein [Thalassotalea ponticola]|uniref:Lpp/OprI family alanine-zipper lipoprotein n=1 Tax=Thalassotalea ponticola TaxID=1523392 RepID=UPI0025B41BEB|nr:Lpp/OprI family alanine-zipper lipoprotein [Thalassotalea ponticola]MDN3652026.1 Lpp/OprI family alanine-zipper lipoprotein [Thalassotalea ponticola]